MSRMYSVSFKEVVVSAAQDLFELLAPADSSIVIHSLHLSQSSDAGDAQSEQLHISINRVTGAPTSGSGGTALSPRPMNFGDSASGATAEGNNTTQISGGTTAILHVEAFNVMAGLQVVWTPETRPVVSPSTRIVVELDTAPADAITMSGTLYFEEIGG